MTGGPNHKYCFDLNAGSYPNVLHGQEALLISSAFPRSVFSESELEATYGSPQNVVSKTF